MLVGNVLIKAKKFDDAITAFDIILVKEPNHWQAKQGKMRAQGGKEHGAVPYYR